MTPISAFATEIAGDVLFYSPGEAESHAGFRILRIDVTKFPVAKNANIGFVETFPEIGLPRVREGALVVPGHDTTLEFVQEPDPYPKSTDTRGTLTSATFGSFTGTLWQWRDQIAFEFYTGESIKGSAIRAIVYSPGGDYTVDDIRHFVEALYFGS